MRVDFEHELTQGCADEPEGEYTETFHVIADVEDGDVTLIEPEPRWLDRHDLWRLVEAAADYAERLDKAAHDEIADMRAARVPTIRVEARGAFALVPARPEQIIGTPEWRKAQDAAHDRCVCGHFRASHATAYGRCDYGSIMGEADCPCGEFAMPEGASRDFVADARTLAQAAAEFPATPFPCRRCAEFSSEPRPSVCRECRTGERGAA